MMKFLRFFSIGFFILLGMASSFQRIHIVIDNMKGLQLLHFISISNILVPGMPLSLSSSPQLQSKPPQINRLGIATSRVLGFEYIAEHDWLRAEDVFVKICDQNKRDEIASYWLGHVYASEGRWQDAANIWAQTNAPKKLINIADNLVARGSTEEGIYWYKLAIQSALLSQEKVVSWQVMGFAYRGIGEVYRERGEFLQAAEYYEQAVYYYPDIQYRYLLGTIYLSLHSYDEAIHQILLAMDENRSETWLLEELGYIYIQAGQWDLAYTVLAHSLEVETNNYWRSRAWFDMSVIYYQRHAFEDGLKAAFQAVQNRKGIDGSWIYQFTLLSREALETYPDLMDVYLLIGDLYFSGGDFMQAQYYYQLAQDRWPDDQNVIKRLELIKNHK
jgi:tetratricopeptide (TPR) repeat protein